MQIHLIDTLIIIVYIAAILLIGCWAGLKGRKDDGGRSYFLAGGTLTWPMIGLALFSTNISTIHLVSFAQEGYMNGLAYGNFEWMAPFLLIILALFFAPLYLRSAVTTLPDFLERRFSRPSRDFLAFVSIVSAIFIHIGFSLYTGAVVLEGMFGIPLMVSILGITVVTGIYTIAGGLKAVVVTESIQTVILLSGAIMITLIGLDRVGGWEGIKANVDPVKLTILRPADDPSNLPWYSVFLGYPIIGLWYWCADQTIVQRVLGAKDENHARVGALFAGFIKILPVFIFVLPGLMCLALIRQGELPNDLTDSKDTYAFMIMNLLPTGLSGIMAATLLAALMSTVSGALNSIATLFSYDIWRRWSPETPEKSLVLIGRIATFVAMVAAIIWSPMLEHYESIFQGVSTAICYIAPPITAVFVWGLFLRLVSPTGAIVTLWSGFGLGLATFILDWNQDKLGIEMPSFMMMSFYLFLACSAILLVVSSVTPYRHTEDRMAMIWHNPMEAIRGDAWRGLGNFRLLAAVLFVVMVGLYWVFR